MVAGDNIETAVLKFKMPYADLIEYVYDTIKGIELSIAVFHIFPFLHSTDHCLGTYCEQTGEAIHHGFKKTYRLCKTTKIQCC